MTVPETAAPPHVWLWEEGEAGLFQSGCRVSYEIITLRSNPAQMLPVNP